MVDTLPGDEVVVVVVGLGDEIIILSLSLPLTLTTHGNIQSILLTGPAKRLTIKSHFWYPISV